MFSSPSVATRPLPIKVCAAFFTDMQMGALLFRRADDQVDLRENAPLIGRIVVREGAAGGFHAADAFGRAFPSAGLGILY